MSDHTAFLATIARNPADMGPRLVFADWLEERGDPHAEYIRLAIELDRKQCQCNPPCSSRIDYDCKSRIHQRCAALLAEYRAAWTMAGLPEDWSWCRGCYLTEQKPHVATTDGSNSGIVEADFARGFPEILTCRFEEWQRHYQTLIDSMPVREVRLTTMPNIHNYAELDEGTFKISIVIEINGNWYRADATSNDVAIITILKRAFPGHDAARPIRYTLPQVTLHHGTISTTDANGNTTSIPVFPYRADAPVGGIP